MQVLLSISLVDPKEVLAGLLDSELKAQEWVQVGNGPLLYVKTFKPATSGFELSDIIKKEVTDAGLKAELNEVGYVYVPIANPVSVGIAKPFEN